MYTPLQQRRYALNHLEAGCWYLDCPTGYTPDEEVQIRRSLDATSTPPAGASDVVDITEDESAQPAPDEGSAPKKKRMTKATKEAAEKEAKQKEAAAKEVAMKEAAAKATKEMEKQPVDATTGAASCIPSSPPVVIEGHFLNLDRQGTSTQVSSQLHPSYSVVEATEELRGQRIFQQMPSGSTSTAQALRVEVMLENASLFAVMETLGTSTGPDPLWMKVHEFITKVNCISSLLLCFYIYFITLLNGFFWSLIVLSLVRIPSFFSRLDWVVHVVSLLQIASTVGSTLSLPTFRRTYQCLVFQHLVHQFQDGTCGLRDMWSPYLSLVMRICMMTQPFFFFIVMIEHCTPKLKKLQSNTTFAYAKIGGELMTLPWLLQSSPRARYDTFFFSVLSYCNHYFQFGILMNFAGCSRTVSGFSCLFVMILLSHCSLLRRTVSFLMLVYMLKWLILFSTSPPSRASSCVGVYLGVDHGRRIHYSCKF